MPKLNEDEEAGDECGEAGKVAGVRGKAADH